MVLRDVVLFANKQCSKMVAGAAFVAVVVYQNEWTISLVGGAIFNAAMGKLLKRVLQFSRPETSQRESHGMPSSHANSLCFYTTSLCARAYMSPTTTTTSFVVQAVGLSGYTAAICYARVVLTKDHTPAQVFVGACVGAVCALALEINRPLY